jgi:hypothetical protein
MANKKFLVPLGLVSLASDPASGTEGELYYNSVSDGVRLYKNGAWTDLASTGALPSGGSVGQILAKSSNTDYAVEWIENYADYTETVKLKVKNDGTRELYKGQPVHVTGSDGTNVLIGRSTNATEAGSSKTLGILAENLATNGQGFVIMEGKLGTLDTSTAGAVGDPVWLGVDGALIYGLANKPYGPAHLVYLGVVTKKNGSTGEIFVNVQNGFELEEIHNVGIGYGATIADNEVLAYDTTSSLWINQTPAEAGLATSSHNHTVDSLSNVVITGTPTDGQAIVWDTATSKWVNESVANSVAGTGSQIDVTSTTGNITLSLPSAMIAPGDLTVTGNLTVSGTTTTINTQNLNVKDNIIVLNSGVTGTPTGTAGIEIERGTETNTSILWEETTQSWKFSNDIQAYIIRSAGSLQLSSYAISGENSSILLENEWNSFNLASSGNVEISPGNDLGHVTYAFSKTSITFPDTSQQSTAFLGISSYDTDDISEGTRLYYTDERAQDAIGNSLGVGLSYNDTTGAISNSGVLSIIGTTNEIVITGTNAEIQVGIPDSPVFVTPNIGVATATSVNGTTIPSSKTLVITDDIGVSVQPWSSTIAGIEQLGSGTGFLKNTAGTWSYDNSAYAPLASPTFTGNVTIGEAVTKTTSTNLTSSSATVIATIPIPSGKELVSSECLVLISSTNDGTYYTSKCLVFGGYPAGEPTADITEYAIMGDMDATLSASFVGSNVQLSVQVTDYINVTAKVVSTSIAADNGAT